MAALVPFKVVALVGWPSRRRAHDVPDSHVRLRELVSSVANM
eukprot:CAMPEP_0170508436 /NCGR_PEP_ID=MMETSP0208-20121228/62292_1 /TAXON_ID=197538 /ORGANISM="Strombidium inclinatum, Strain S3" /LENGTH=41 /DNA_ID= /DNA_START= /DNA_END= /DNA_ORIENTATION=